MHEELIISGAGGQGILFAGDLIAWANILMGRKVVWVPVYGPERRAGKSMCSVIISDEEINSPIIEHPDSIIVMNEVSLCALAPMVKSGGLILGNRILSDVDVGRSDVEIVMIDSDTVANELGSRNVANVVLIGAYAKIKEPVLLDKLIERLKIVFVGDEKKYVLNITAFLKGFKHID